MQPATLANYHTHTSLCHHASGTEEEYIQVAIQNGFQILGFSDHAPFPTTEDYLNGFRMSCDELPEHVKTIRALQKKYADQIKIYLGFEAEYFPEHLDWLEAQMEHYQLDYLGLGHHFDPLRGEDGYFGAVRQAVHFTAYEKTSIAAMESGKFRFFAHPDLYLNAYHSFDKACEHTAHAICEAAAALGMPLEYNLLGVDRRASGDAFSSGLGYTRPEFWEIAAKYNTKAIIGCDAHAPSQLDHGKRIVALKQQLRDTGIEVLDVLPGLD
ncbi:MAG: histidinol-phosphatase [Faecalibacterium sp.]